MKRMEREKQLSRMLEELGFNGLLDGKDIVSKTYNRILTPEERKLIDADSFGYLLSLYRMGTIDSIKLEQYIDYCLSIAYYEEEQLSLERTKRIVNLLLYCDNMSLKKRDFAALFRECEEEICTLDIIH